MDINEISTYESSFVKARNSSYKQAAGDYKKAFVVALVGLPFVWIIISVYLIVA